ncbi:hypothetical protein ACFWPQ_02170 [Streptomyces sp. NPDC058464]|uniref:hypothetical protein n=1 Tax=Streptomyces sp. NPDC058464 TaxID=3346511 RepID=UPI003665906E
MGTNLERLAKLVAERRLELGLGVEPAAKRASMSKDTWKRVEAAKNVQDTTYTRIERALQWALGSCGRVLDGKDPITLDSTPAAEDSAVAIIPKEELRRHVGDSVNSAALGIKGDLTADQILDLNERVLKELHERGVI